MYILTYHATPTKEHEQHGTIEGAYVAAWIPSVDAADHIAADNMARANIHAKHWNIDEMTDHTIIPEEGFQPSEENRQAYETVLSGEQAYIFSSYGFVNEAE
ncbi:hypothetical protein Rhal01_01368 [Rubritalea halochordaticola]|uniref:Uncharacterized protein n=1 Tax=Rubritalea halochordaticola TaxID=714537 RepID=A0ABP9UY67_9BACT